MKVLLIAYEFPPVLAAQSLRWFYLANGLAGAGVQVHVVCPDMPAAAPFPVGFHSAVVTHRVWAGPFVGISQGLALRASSGVQVQAASGALHHRPWSLRAYQVARRVLDALVYPDVRTEWYPFARAKVNELLASGGFDAVISSHEPAVDLFVGLFAKRRYGLPWVVDMGDPLLTPYSPWWRRRLDLHVERRIVRQADAVWVTTSKVADLLAHRHGADIQARFVVIPQGFPVKTSAGSDRSARTGAKMTLLFTGTFYRSFRNPEQLALSLRQLVDLPISFIVVGDNSAFASLFQGLPDVQFLGKRDHFDCLDLQRNADVLVNLGNVQDFQVPGKVYEYLGAGAPILHIQTGPADSSAELITLTGAGVVVQNQADTIAQALRRLHALWQGGNRAAAGGRRQDLIAEHAWPKRVERCLQSLRAVCARTPDAA